MSAPLVSVVCLCYNQAKWLEEAVESVINQTYSPVQIIVADDASTDGSQRVIERLKEKYQQLEILLLSTNVGNCIAFNRALSLVKGSYVIDFAADDVMEAERIRLQVEHFNASDERVGVVFTDAIYIDAEGNYLRSHNAHLRKKKLIEEIPQGDIFRMVLHRYFIASPTMMIRKDVFDALGGYDETLAYEDFDFWVRSSRTYFYSYLDKKLTRIRRTGKSMSSGLYQANDKQLHSTYRICQKASTLCRSKEDVDALIKRIRYELRHSVFSENHHEATLFYGLLADIHADRRFDKFLLQVSSLHLPLARMRRWYHFIRYHG